MSKLTLVVPVGRDFRLLDRCLEHYKALGVDQILLNLHARTEWGTDLVDCIRAVGEGFGAKVAHVHSQIYIESYLTTRVLLDHHTDPDEWIVYSDVDEFHEYPDSLHNIIRYCEEQGYEYVQGLLLDRVAADGSLPMLNDRPLHEQFPVGAQITQGVRGGDPRKVVLARSRVKIAAGQHFTKAGYGAPLSELKVTVHHFRWDSEAPSNLAYMVNMLSHTKAEWHVEHQRVLTYLDANNNRFDLSLPGLMSHYPAPIRYEYGKGAPDESIAAEDIELGSILCHHDGDSIQWEEDGKFSLIRFGKSISSLNVSAAIVWALCDGGRTVEDIISELAVEYCTAADRLRKEVLETAKVLACQQLLKYQPSERKQNRKRWSPDRQPYFLRHLSFGSHPRLYQDTDLCHGLLANVRDTAYHNRTLFHFYWRQVNSPFGDKQMACLTSFLATQSLESCKAVLWYAGNDAPSHLALTELVEAGYIHLQRYEPKGLAVDTPLQGCDELLTRKDSKCYLDGDLFRLLALFRYGGVYIDMDVLLLRDLSPLLGFEFMYSWGGKQAGQINGAVMRFFPGSAAVHAMLRMLKQVQATAESTNWGAGVYGNVHARYPFTILPYSFFNPEWTWFDGNHHEYAENPETFFVANPQSKNIYRHAFAWHWHGKWENDIETGSKFDLLSSMLNRAWVDKRRFYEYCKEL